MGKIEWLKERQKGIGGSDVGAILGVNKWKSPFQVYIEKTEPIVEENEQNETAYWGNELEDMVAREFAKRTGKKVRRDTKHLVHKEYPFMVANIDRRIVGENAILECKTTSAYNSKEWENGEVPASYLLQCQHYMAVTGTDKCYIACLIGGQRFVYYELIKDNELITFIIEQEREFWTRVENKTPPTLDGSSAAEKYLNEKFINSDPTSEVLLTSDYEEKIKELQELKLTAKELDLKIKGIENNIKLELGEAERGILQGYTVNWKAIKSNRVDSKALKEKYPYIYKEVCKESISRRFEIKEDKE